MKEALRLREAAQQEFAVAWHTKDKLEFQQKSHRDKGKEDKAMKMETQVAEARDKVRYTSERMNDITKGILNFEASRMSKQCVDAWVKIMGQFSALSFSSGAKTQELWSTMLDALGMDRPVSLRFYTVLC